ncbi:MULTISPECIES: IS200/IS605 family transposase [unclassified Saccharicrinis]|uniref:IS200/IS605 family transposase n=1 Tax=unclassified Saccharicrinis TaxID=2646859 RepID=UPI003D3475FF
MKPGTFTQIYIQLVFSPFHREALLVDKIRPRVFEYMGGIIRTLNHKSIIINGMKDHVHLLVGLNPKVSVSDTVKEVKRLSSIFINDLKVFNGRFQWQEGFGAFSYGRSQLDDIYNYVKNQEDHHQKQSFKKEYSSFLKKFEVEFDEHYLFKYFE